MNHGKRTKRMSKLDYKTSMLRSSLCNYGEAYILVKEIITIRSIAPWVKEIMVLMKR